MNTYTLLRAVVQSNRPYLGFIAVDEGHHWSCLLKAGTLMRVWDEDDGFHEPAPHYLTDHPGCYVPDPDHMLDNVTHIAEFSNVEEWELYINTLKNKRLI